MSAALGLADLMATQAAGSRKITPTFDGRGHETSYTNIGGATTTTAYDMAGGEV